MKYFILACSLLVLASCNTLKPIYKDISAPDYNSRIIVSGAGYIKKSNAVGLSFQIAGPVAGAYAGYESDLIKIPDGNTQKSAPIVNAAVGAIIGYSIPFTLNLLGGKNKKSNVSIVEKWVKKKYPNYLVVKKISNSNFVIIPKNVESNFEIHDIQDVRDFVSLFPKSEHENDVFSKSVSNLERVDLPELISLVPMAKNLNSAKIKYYNSSSDVSQLKEAMREYPSQKKGCNDCRIINNLYLTADKSELIYMAKEFPNSSCSDKIYDKLLSDLETVNQSIELLGDLPVLKQEIIPKSITLSKSVDECVIISNKFTLNQSEKESLLTKSLLLAQSTNDFFKIKNEYPSQARRIGLKAVSRFENLQDLSYISKKIPSVSLEAEKKASKAIKTYQEKKEFLKYFNSGLASDYLKKQLESEFGLRRALQEYANSYANKMMKYTSPHSDFYEGELIDYKIEDGQVMADIKIMWKGRINSVMDRLWERCLDDEGETGKLVTAMGDVKIIHDINSNKTRVIKESYNDIARILRKQTSTDQMFGIAFEIANDVAVGIMKSGYNMGLFEYLDDVPYDDKEIPCYTILDKSENFLSGTITYTVKCRNGDVELINYYPSEDRYSNTLLSPLFTKHTSFAEAIKDYCGCN